MDNEVISAPTVQTAITNGQAMITGSFTAEGAEQLASLIRAGSLPFNLNVIQMKNVGARLGADALSTGIKAGIIGIALVLIYMLFAYKLLGFAADWELVIYIGLELVAAESVPCDADIAWYRRYCAFGRYGGRCEYRYF